MSSGRDLDFTCITTGNKGLLMAELRVIIRFVVASPLCNECASTAL